MTLCEIFGKWVANLQFSCWLMTYARPCRWGGETTTMRRGCVIALQRTVLTRYSGPI